MATPPQQPTPPTPAAAPGPPRPQWLVPLIAVLVCAVAVVAAYSNSTRGGFFFDDWHTITQNPSVRSLGNIPRFFADASTFSVFPDNIDYRPVLQTTYALDYAWALAAFGDGYDPRPWHRTNLFLHFTVAVSLFFLGRRLIGTGRLTDFPGLPAPHGDWVALAAAATLAVHPTTAACANYISARSTLLAAALALPALTLYLHVLARPERRLLLVPSLVLYALALLTKVEAVSLLPVLFVAEMLLARGEPALFRRFWRREPWLRLGAFVLVTALYLVVWRSLSPLVHSRNRAALDMTPFSYLCTQFSAWWYYIGHLFAPFHLVADEQDFPVARSILDPRAALALAGWVLVVYIAAGLRRIAPAVTFLVASFFLFLLPHSSVVPLGEMVNEHRPYLPTAGLFIVVFAALYAALVRLGRFPLAGVAAAAVILALPLIALTRERNLVWTDDLTLWRDTARKTPHSPRARNNYGLALMRRGLHADAEVQFRESLRLHPGYAQANANLATVLEHLGDTAGAAAALDRTVALDADSPAAYYRRGAFRARRAEIDKAIADFALAADRNPTPLRELAALAECLIHAGRGPEAEPVIQAGRALNAAAFESERAAFRTKELTPK